MKDFVFVDDCNWTTPCHNSTICFRNGTGCPVSGSFRVHMEGAPPCGPGMGRECTPPEGTVEGGSEEDASDASMDLGSYNTLMLILLGITIVTIFLGLLFSCIRKPETPKPRYALYMAWMIGETNFIL